MAELEVTDQRSQGQTEAYSTLKVAPPGNGSQPGSLGKNARVFVQPRSEEGQWVSQETWLLGLALTNSPCHLRQVAFSFWVSASIY